MAVLAVSSGEMLVSGGGQVKVVTEAIRETAGAVQRFADEARDIAALLTRLDTTRPHTFVAENLPGIDFQLDGTICVLQSQALLFDLLSNGLQVVWHSYLAVEGAQSWSMESLEASLWNVGGQIARAAIVGGALDLLAGFALAGPLGVPLLAQAPWVAGITRLAGKPGSMPPGGDPLRWFSTAAGARFIRHIVDNADDLERGVFGVPPGVGSIPNPRAREDLVRRWGAMLPGPKDGRVTIDEVASSKTRQTSADSLKGMIGNIMDGDPFENGRIRVDIVEGEDGVRRAVVYLGGTELSPGSAEDMPSNLSAYADLDSGFMRAVEMAMKEKLGSEGLPLDTPVTFVGYSQGGLAASRLIESGHWNAVGLLTVGSPGTWIVLPEDLPHIAIEHVEDPIAALNGAERAHNRPDAVIVTSPALEGEEPTEFLSGHKLDLYEKTAGAVDSTTDRAVVEERVQLLANATGTVVASSTYAAIRVDNPAPGATTRPQAAVPTPTPPGEGWVSADRARPAGAGGRR